MARSRPGAAPSHHDALRYLDRPWPRSLRPVLVVLPYNSLDRAHCMAVLFYSDHLGRLIEVARHGEEVSARSDTAIQGALIRSAARLRIWADDKGEALQHWCEWEASMRLVKPLA